MGTYNRDGDPEADGAYEVIDALLDLGLIRLWNTGVIGKMEIQGAGESLSFDVEDSLVVGLRQNRNQEVRIVRDALRESKHRGVQKDSTEDQGIRSYEMPVERGHLRCQQFTDDPDEAINAWKEALKEHRFKSKMQANTVLEEAEASDDKRLEEIGSWLAGDHQEDCGCGLCESFQSWCKAER